MQEVGDVPVHEDVAGLEAEDCGFGYARVRAADPEDLGLLAGGERREEVGLLLGGLGGPFFVFADGGVDGVCGGWLVGEYDGLGRRSL